MSLAAVPVTTRIMRALAAMCALVALAGRAFQVIDWDATHRFCGRCGARIGATASMPVPAGASLESAV